MNAYRKSTGVMLLVPSWNRNRNIYIDELDYVGMIRKKKKKSKI